jgi:hypothetical protein
MRSQKQLDGTFFLCRSCHTLVPSLTKLLNVTNGNGRVLDHFKVIHYQTYEDNANSPFAEYDRTNAVENLDLDDPKQQKPYNSIAGLFDPVLIQKDILCWVWLELSGSVNSH